MQQGKIILSCGHQDPRKPTGWELHGKEFRYKDGDYYYSIYSVSYCTQCFCASLLRDTEHVWTNYEEAMEAVYGQAR